ncbi:MAG: sigma-54-dependent Fis family transcriptional regulator [Deltaproteobacteria bacterium]|nr:sigma-54-dependent Fis family transcriptional regulator [Deltaproteobacteria bacterium]
MKRESTILVVDDETKIRRLLETSLVQRGYVVITAGDGEEACSKLDASIDLVVTDLKMPNKDGLEVLAEARRRGLNMPVIVMTAYGTVDSAVQAMRGGAFDYITKPFDLDALEMVVARALQFDALASVNRFLRESEERGIEDMVGRSEQMKQLFNEIRQVAPARAAVLVVGETGTGKERVARAIHALSDRREELFVPINCAAIPLELLESELFGHTRGAFTGATDNRVGKFELASGGTLFLDEIGDMPLPLQAKILRILEEGVIERIGSNRSIRVDTRVVSATHRRLEDAIRAGTFREDLYYRLNVLQLRVPAVRDRAGDVPLLAAHFLETSARQMDRPPLKLDRDALELLEAYSWPGNVRELRNVCERLSVLCRGDRVDVAMVSHLLDLPEPTPASAAGKGPAPTTLAAAVAKAEIEAIESALARSGGNKAKAARLLAVSERNLWYKIKKHDIATADD